MMDFNLFYLILVILNIVTLSAAMFFVWGRLEARGAKGLFLFLFGLLGFITMYLCSLLIRRESAKGNMMAAAFGFFLLLPIFWIQFIYQVSGRDPKKLWHFNLPIGILNSLGFLLFLFKVPGLRQLMYFHTCNINGPIYNCRVVYSSIFYLTMGLVLLEFIGGGVLLLYNFFRETENEERNRYLFLVLAASVGIFSVWLILISSPNSLNVFDPLPIAMIATTVMLVVATFNRRLLEIRLGGEPIAKVDDLLLVIDRDHYILDVNMSTLQVFDLEVEQVISTQLEVAFVEHPEIINLFREESNATTAPLKFEVNDLEHTFLPTVSTVLDPETSLPSGQRLQLRDVTGQRVGDLAGSKSVTIMRDSLTNQYTSDSFYQFGEKLLRSTRRREEPVALVVIDIDDFHSVNERFSHLVGDQGLIQLVEIINTVIRSTDLLARFQQDDLVLLLPNADEFAAYQVCARIKEIVANHRFSFQAQIFQMTVSIGYTTVAKNEQYNLDQIVDVAYQALDQSHMLGRNRLSYLPAGFADS